MGRLIDADVCLRKAWQNFYKQEDDHRHLDGYDIMRDQYYEQSGFECCQQTIVNAPTVEAIPKDQYEARLKADMVAMLEEIQMEIEEHKMTSGVTNQGTWNECIACCSSVIQQKINLLRSKN